MSEPLDMKATQPTEAEQALLGALLLNNEALTRCGALAPEDFHDPLHGAIYAAIRRESSAGRTASPVLLKPEFLDYPGIETVGGVGYLARLAGAAISIMAVRDYADAIRTGARRRAIVDACDQGKALALDMGQQPDAAIAAVESAILSMGEADDDMGCRSVFRAMTETILPMLEARAAGDSMQGIGSGLPSLDALTGGWRPGQLIILAGRPGMGKSATALFFARSAAAAGHGVHFASLEMTNAELAIRQAALEIWAAERRWVHYNRMLSGDIEDHEAQAMLRATQAVQAMPLRLGSERARAIGSIAADARRSAKLFEGQGRSLDLVVIDQLSHITPPRQRQSKVHEVGDISRAAKELARMLQVPVVLLAQLNRGVETRDDKRPILSDLRDSGDIEQDADKVIFCLRQEYYLDQEKVPDEPAAQDAFWKKKDAARDRIELIVAKNRMGRTGSARAFCSIGVNAFAEVE